MTSRFPRRISTRHGGARCSSSPPEATRTASSTSARSQRNGSPRSSRRPSGAPHSAPRSTSSPPQTCLPSPARSRRCAPNRSLRGGRSRSHCSPTRSPRNRPVPCGAVASRFRLQPYSRADAPYFRSPGFYVRIGGLAVILAAGVTLLLLRAWSLQVLHGKQYASLAHQQAYRTVDLIGARGAIVDDRGRLIAGTTGHVVIDADAASLGTRDAHGVWHPSAGGLKEIARFAKFAGTRKR